MSKGVAIFLFVAAMLLYLIVRDPFRAPPSPEQFVFMTLDQLLAVEFDDLDDEARDALIEALDRKARR